MNIRRSLGLAAVLLAATAACRTPSTPGQLYDIGHGRDLGIVREGADGTRTWAVRPGHALDPRLVETLRSVDETPRVGIVAATLNRERAERVGVSPWVGIYVADVLEDSPASRAGLVPGDVVFEVAEQPVSSAEQFADTVAMQARVGEPLPVRIYQKRGPGDPVGNGAEGQPKGQILELVPSAHAVPRTDSFAIPLEAAAEVQHYTGLQVAELDEDVTGRIYGSHGARAVLVTAVASGSPAYHAGLRIGDRVLRCDDVPVLGVDDVSHAFDLRLRRKYPDAPVFDAAVRRLAQRADVDPDAPVELEVVGPLGSHTARVDLRDDVGERTRFSLPILVDYDATMRRTEFDVLNFIFQFGWTYDRWTTYSDTRLPAESSRFSLFPFGMFEVESTPHSSEYTLFWFLRFGSAR